MFATEFLIPVIFYTRTLNFAIHMRLIILTRVKIIFTDQKSRKIWIHQSAIE